MGIGADFMSSRGASEVSLLAMADIAAVDIQAIAIRGIVDKQAIVQYTWASHVNTPVITEASKLKILVIMIPFRIEAAREA